MQILIEGSPGAWTVLSVPDEGEARPHPAYVASILLGVASKLLESHVTEELPVLLGESNLIQIATSNQVKVVDGGRGG